ncbi:MAG TPA: response regulator transcription factor [Reyranella sp.]
MAPKLPRVLIVDDHPVVRMGLRAVVEQTGRYEVVGEAGTPAEAVQAAARQQPDVVILDLMLGGRSGADLAQQCLATAPGVRILVLSQHDEALHAERVLGAGAHGYLMKGADLDGVVQALDAVLRGEIVLSPRMNARILARRFHGAPQVRYSDLSNREMQIFLLIGAGLTTGQIATDLSLSPKTIGAHREKIKTKLGLETASELEREALLYVERGG